MPVGIAIVQYLTLHRLRLTPVRVILAALAGGLLPVCVLILLVQPFFETDRALQAAKLMVEAIYPPLDLLVATGGFLCLFAYEGKNWRQPWFLIGSALALWAYTDLWYWLLEFLNSYGLDLLTILRVEIPYDLAYVILGVGSLQAAAQARSDATPKS